MGMCSWRERPLEQRRPGHRTSALEGRPLWAVVAGGGGGGEGSSLSMVEGLLTSRPGFRCPVPLVEGYGDSGGSHGRSLCQSELGHWCQGTFPE